MTILLDQRDDGSLAAYIDGDLQFDSRDEYIYHEALVLPALALAARRRAGSLRALICGGGDGLAARELLKSARLIRLDLVDYDPAIVRLARGVLADLNRDSLNDTRTRVSTEDAWDFISRAARARRRYDLIVVDLTVPQDLDGARLHSVEWYERLAQLLPPDGLLAVNGASPSAAASAYWSIYNSLRAAHLHPRPYRVVLPSFAAHGYGDDWGFLLASPQPIAAAELDDGLPLATPRHALHTPAHLRRLFTFPAASAALRATVRPTRLGSGLLLHYLFNSPPVPDPTDGAWDGLALVADDAPLPAADDGRRLLPAELHAALAATDGAAADPETVWQRVVDLMPALRRDQTRDMVAAFLAAPGRFLAAIDLPGLVDQLLRRASELPRRLVAELRLLRARLRGFAGDHEALLRLGLRVVTVVTLVVITANLLYPDAVYGKGGDSGSSGGSPPASMVQSTRNAYDPRAVEPDLAVNGGYRRSAGGQGVAVDETGTVFPARRYRYYSSSRTRTGYTAYSAGAAPTGTPFEEEGAYRLTPDTDILPNGQVVVNLTEQTYLLLGDEVTTLVERQSGAPLLYLEREPAQHWRVVKEIERQRLGLQKSATAKEAWLAWMNWLQFAPWHAEDQIELRNLQATGWRLDQALTLLGPAPAAPPPLPAPPVESAVEAFSGVWLLPDGRGLALRLPDGLAFMDGQGWYRDQARSQPLTTPYPTGFRTAVVNLLRQQIANRDATLARLRQELDLAGQELATLESDKREYEEIGRTQPDTTQVEYGTSEIPLREALRRTNDDIARTQQYMALLSRQLATLPADLALAERVIAALGQ